MKSYGAIAYEAYGDSVGWKAYNGEPMPKWGDLPDRIRGAWEAASMAVIDDRDAMRNEIENAKASQ